MKRPGRSRTIGKRVRKGDLHMIRRLVVIAAVLPLLLAAGLASAQSAREAREQVEMSMLVRGHVDIDREGRITAHELEQPDKLPEFVIDMVSAAMPTMLFEPVMVDGSPVLARAKMTLRLVAQPDGEQMRLSIRSAHFGDETAVPDEERVRSVRMTPPSYPKDALYSGGTGTVYLLLKVGRDGQVEDVVVEQTNLTALGSAREMDRIRSSLERASVREARRWRYEPPVAGEEADAPYWAVRVPVEYHIDSSPTPDYGQWVAYHPGERAPRPDWAKRDAPGFSPDLLAAGATHPAQSRFRLLQAPEG